jgi:hypothetical protein
MKKKGIILFVMLFSLFFVSFQSSSIFAEEQLPVYLKDRGTGIATSMFGTYVRPGELLIYPFVEYYQDADGEYAPEEFGYVDDTEYEGEFRGTEELIFIGYGLNEHWAFELEIAVMQASLEKADDDTSSMPDKIEASGLGDVEGQIRYRWCKENEKRPEVFSYFETVFPTVDEESEEVLIGTPDWEFKLGVGIIKGFSWGTMTLRAAVQYDKAEDETEFGETAVEYLKRINPKWRVFLAVEGEQDEWEGIAELQWHFRPNMFLKLNNAVGLTPKADDWAPEVGIMFIF